MARENAEAFKRAVDAGTRGDLEALLKKLDPEGGSHPTLDVLLGGAATVYRGDMIAAIGGIRACGANGGVEIELSLGLPGPVQRGKAILSRGYLDPTLESAGLLV